MWCHKIYDPSPPFAHNVTLRRPPPPPLTFDVIYGCPLRRKYQWSLFKINFFAWVIILYIIMQKKNFSTWYLSLAMRDTHNITTSTQSVDNSKHYPEKRPLMQVTVLLLCLMLSTWLELVAILFYFSISISLKAFIILG